MSATTGPVLALGAVTVINQTVFHDEAMDWRIPIATGLLAVAFNLAERAAPQAAEVLAWTSLLAVLFTRLNPDIPSPVESAITWWDDRKTTKKTSGSEQPSGPAGSMEV